MLTRPVVPGLENALEATVATINRPGVGGLLAINQLTAAPFDGSQAAIVNGTGAAAVILAEAEGPEFGFADLSYLGRIAVDDPVVTTDADSEYQTWEEIEESEEFRFASTGRGSSDCTVANALIEIFALQETEVLVGFDSQSEAGLALVQGNVDAIAGPLDSYRASIESGQMTAVLSFADEAPADAADAAMFSEIDLFEDGEGLTDGTKLTEYGRPLVAQGGMEDETLGCLQDALEAAMEDPEFFEQAEEMQRELSYLSGKEFTTHVVPAFDELPADFIIARRMKGPFLFVRPGGREDGHMT